MVDFLSRPLFLVLLCGAAYAVATWAMKTASQTPATPVLAAIVICLTAAAIAEVLLLRHHNVGVIFIAVIVVETALVLTVAFALGEGLTLRQGMGAALVVFGAIILNG
jgi:drug/metabolite transporter (DMT)-like permease